MSRRARNALREGLIVVFFSCYACLQTGLGLDLSRSFFAGPDPIVDLWTLRFVTANLVERPSQLFEANNFYPTHDVLLFSDPLLGPAVLGLPFWLATRNPILVYNLALLLGLVLASFGSYLLARRLVGHPGPALLAGILVPYSPYQTNHLTHLNLVTIAGFPFLLIGLFKLLERPGPGPSLLTGLAFAFQAGTSGYHAFSSAFICLLVGAWGWRRLLSRRVLAFSAAALLVALALLAPYLLSFRALHASGEMSRSLEDNAFYSLDVGCDLRFSESWPWKRLLGTSPRPLFPGLVAPALAAFALAKRRDRHTFLLALMMAFFTLLAMGPELRFCGRSLLPLPFRALFDHLPFFNAGRHPNTYVAPAFLALALLAALGLASLSAGSRRWLLAVGLVFGIGERFVPSPLQARPEIRLPEVYRVLADQPPGAMIELPLEAESTRQWWSIFHGLPTVNGASPFEPRPHVILYQWISREWKRAPAQDMEGWRSVEFLKKNFPVRYLVAHAETRPAVLRNLEATTRTFVFLSETPAGDRLYRILRGGGGRAIERGFVDDQLQAGVVVARVRGPATGRLLVSFNDRELVSTVLTSTWRDLRVDVPRSAIRRGLNSLRLALSDGPGNLELADVEAADH